VIGLIYSRLRPEEKLLIQELRKRNSDALLIDDDRLTFDVGEAIFFRASIAFSALYSCAKPNTAFMRTMLMMM